MHLCLLKKTLGLFTRDAFTVSDQDNLSSAPTGAICPTFVASQFGAVYAYRNFPWPDHVTAPASAYGCTQDDPEFDGHHGAGQGKGLEKHPSPVQNITQNPSWFDMRPWNIDPINLPETATRISGATYLYKGIGFEANGVLALDENGPSRD